MLSKIAALICHGRLTQHTVSQTRGALASCVSLYPVDSAKDLAPTNFAAGLLMQVVGPQQVCGNGIVEGLEQCDDGDTVGGDGCSATCQVNHSSQ
jgi:cysteine-rich repeat protein